MFDKNIRIGARRSKRRNRLVLFPIDDGEMPDADKTNHLTITESGQHLEIHRTDAKTGEHTSVLDVDFYWVTTRLANPAFLDEFRRRLIERSFLVPFAHELRAIRTKARMLVPTEQNALLPDADGVVDAPPFYSVAMRGLRRAQPGTTWAALGEGTECLGLVWIARASRKQRLVLFTPCTHVLMLLHWFMSEIAGPSGHIPAFEEHDVA